MDITLNFFVKETLECSTKLTGHNRLGTSLQRILWKIFPMKISFPCVCRHTNLSLDWRLKM